MRNRIIPKITLSRRYKTLPHDSYMMRLESSLIGHGMLAEGNKYLMDLAIREMPEGGHVLEIGSYAGLSSVFMIWLIQKHQREAQFVSCDPWIYEGYEDHTGRISPWMDGRNDVSRLNFMKYIKEGFMNAHKLFNEHNLPHTFELKSDEFFEFGRQRAVLKDIFGRESQLPYTFSFAYIDGDHSLEATRKDFENVDNHLLNSGFVLFDNSADTTMGSTLFMTEMLENQRYKLVDKNPNYLFQKIA